MPLYTDDINEIKSDIDLLKNDIKYTFSGIPPQFGIYPALGYDLYRRGPIGTMLRSPFTLINQQTMGALIKSNIYGLGLNGSLFNIINFSSIGNVYNTIRFPGMWGTRWIQRPILQPLAGLTSKIPIIGNIVSGYANAALGFNLNIGNIPGLRIDRSNINHIKQILQNIRSSGAIRGDQLSQGFRLLGLDVNNLVNQYAINANLSDEARSLLLRDMSRIKLVGGIGKLLGAAFGAYTAYDISSSIGKLVSGAVRTGAHYTEIVNKYATKIVDRMRNVEMGGDLSAYLTQAAVTERTRALQIMQASRVNGAYQYGNETEFI